jgi:putative peptidoglycan lipid II flippase
VLAEPSAKKGSGGYALLVAAGILLSRIAGLIRERVFAHYFGSSPAAGAFKAALRIPNFLQNMFGEGVLSASFIPVYAGLLARNDEKTAGRVAGVVASILALVVALLVAVGMLFTPAIVALIAPGFRGEIRELTVTLVRILFPGVGLLVLSAWCLGILNSHRRFFISYVAPVLWNAAMIATMVLFAVTDRSRLAVYLAWGTVAGCVLQLVVQLPFVWQYGREIRFGIDLSLAPVREVIRNFVPVFFGRGVVQVSAYIDEIIASLLGAAVFASLSFAQTIYLLPISVFGMSVAAAELPEMSRERGSGDDFSSKLRGRLTAGLQRIAFFVIPTTIAFLIVGRYLVSGLYQTGAFSRNNAFFVWYILAAYSVGLLASTFGRLCSSTFYAMGDTRTPLKIAVVRVLLGAGLAYLFAIPLQPMFETLLHRVFALPPVDLPGGSVALGAVGLALGSSIAAWVEYFLLRRGIEKKVGAFSIGVGYLVRVIAPSLIAAAVALLVARATEGIAHASLPGGLGPLMHAGIVVASFGVIYLPGTVLAGVPESRRLVGRLLRR